VLLSYPGSARVWRRGELGPRGVTRITLDTRITTEFLPLASAGQYHCYDAPLLLDGTIPVPAEAGAWKAEDFIELRLRGIVSDEHALKREIEAWRERHGGKIRRLEIKDKDVSILGGIEHHKLARSFLERWRALEPETGDPDYERKRQIWIRARDLGLNQIKDTLEKSP
jgi:hypothetical protein